MAAPEVPGLYLDPSQPKKPHLERAQSSTTPGNNERPITPTLSKRASLGSLRGAGEKMSPRSPAFRRASSTLAASSSSPSMGTRSNLPPPAEEFFQPAPTAASIAHEYFQKELQMHYEGLACVRESQTVVVLQDDCYGHRYSRPRTSKATLGTIVERPERIHASILGLSTAYVRLGGRHSEGHAPPHSKRQLSSLVAGPFHILKTSRRVSLRSPAATAIHGTRWMTELSAMCDAAESKLAFNGKELTRPNLNTQAINTSEAEQPKLHEGDLYLCSGSLDALEGALGGVCEAIDVVFKDQGPKRAFVCVRPPGHHCSASMPSGFCWLNNVHVGIGHAALTHGLTHAAIIDFDLHHGDGSQAITWAHNARVSSLPKNTPISKKTAIGYFSLHDINSYPCEMGDEDKVRNASLCIENAHGQTIWNVHLQPWKTDAEFWQLYQDRYSVVLSKARDFLRLHSQRLRQAPTHPEPKAAIFLSAGFDASEWESQGMQRHQANVPTDFYARFTRDVAMMAKEEGLGVDGRVISVLEGGYSDRALVSGVLSHVSGLTAADDSSRQRNVANGLAHEMGSRLGNLDINGDTPQNLEDMPRETVEPYDSSWWSLARLEEIEALIKPGKPTVTPQKQRHDSRPKYTSATQSYTAKIVSPPQCRRSFSGNSTHNSQPPSPMSWGPTPPPPAVDWATAAHEFSKLLVPSDRETRSCKPEDLNAEATRARRDRQSNVVSPIDGVVNNLKRMQLRDRKIKLPQSTSDDEQEKPMSRANRRKTFADVSLLAQEIGPTTAGHSGTTESAQRMRRRSSVTSSASSMHAERGSDFSLGSAPDNQPGRVPLVTKKVRAPAIPRLETAKSKAVRKKPVGSVMPKTGGQSGPTESSYETNKVPLSENEELKNKDVDQLVTGMTQMRIKLNVPPKEEYEARQTMPKPASRGRPKSTTAKAAKAASPTKAKAKGVKVSPTVVAKEQLMPQPLPQPATVTGLSQEIPVPVPVTVSPKLQPAAQEFSQPPIASAADPLTSTSSTDLALASDTFPSDHTPSKGIETLVAPLPPAQSPSTSEQSAAPTTPVTAKRTRQELPVFTSTSSLSFGKPASISQSIDRTVVGDDDGQRDSSLQTLSPDSRATLSAPSRPLVNTNQTRISGPAEESQTKEDPLSTGSIWDVPDTPQPRKL